MGKFKGCWELQLLIGVSLNPQNLACLLLGLCFYGLWLISRGDLEIVCPNCSQAKPGAC